ncbi:MAG: amidohydrolase family protein, partial [Gemmatimonadaceae bacterium]
MPNARSLLLWCALVSAPSLHAQSTVPNYDLIIKNARIVDGTGNPWYRGDVAVRGSQIAAVGRIHGTAKRTIDAQDRVVSPGFIDMMGTGSTPHLTEPSAAASRLYQGITTAMIGEGGSEAPQNDATLGEGLLVHGKRVKWRTFAEYFVLLDKAGVPMNVVHNVGAAQVRQIVIGVEDVRPTSEQMERMKGLVDQSMRDGAVGISTALIYPPGTYATTEELIELSKVAAKYGGVYFSHMRNESSGLLTAIQEVIRIGEEAKLPVHIYHLKAAGEENWPLMAQAITLIRTARARGVEITADI